MYYIFDCFLGQHSSEIANKADASHGNHVFIATWNETTYEQILEAYNAGKMCFSVDTTSTPLSISTLERVDINGKQVRFVTPATGNIVKCYFYYSKDEDPNVSISYATIEMQVYTPPNKETWTFTLEDGSTVTKAVYVG